MGIPEAGSGGVRHSSGSSGSRSGGGHRVNTSSRRAGSGTKPSTGSFSQPKRSQPPPVHHHNTHMPPPPPPAPRYTNRIPRTTHVYHHNVPNTTYVNSGYGNSTNSTYTYTGDGTSGSSSGSRGKRFIRYIVYFIILFVLILSASVLLKSCSNHQKQPVSPPSSAYVKQQEIKSNVKRNKLKGGTYVTDCIKDELGWFDDETGTERKLKEFFDKTGVQPYIVLKSYDYSILTDNEKDTWAEEYYEKNFNEENIFLFVYFAEEASDEEIGYMSYVCGYDADLVMDGEAVDIFWDYVDEYWETDLSTDDLFYTIFNQTAKSIM